MVAQSNAVPAAKENEKEWAVTAVPCAEKQKKGNPQNDMVLT